MATTAIAKKNTGNLAAVKNILSMDEMKNRFNEILGAKAGQFMASVTNAVSTNPQLQECDANSVIQSALVAATYDLPIDNNLGFAAIVPYKGNGVSKGQFQLMYKGFVQLAIRSGEYEDMNCSEVYADELVSYNPITGEVKFVDDFSQTTLRESNDPKKRDYIVGYYAWFKLVKGFKHGLYMTKAQVEEHAMKYSRSYQYDIRSGKNSSRWSQDFDAMAKKTVIKQLLSKWGILSIDMQRAISDDQKVYDKDGNAMYLDNPSVKEPSEEAVVDVFAEAVPEGGDSDTFVDADTEGTLPWD